jgi:hypothetical protein
MGRRVVDNGWPDRVAAGNFLILEDDIDELVIRVEELVL